MPTPDFILRLREKIGHDYLWLPGVCVVIFDPDGRTLLGRRSDNGRWAIVSGIPEPGEQPATAVLRECAEETGLSPQLVGVCSVESEEPKTFPNGDRCQFFNVTFVGRVSAEQAASAHVADEESTAVAWFDPDDLPEPLAPLSRARIAVARQWLADGAGPAAFRL